jgi:cyclic beta-1,2-glucan synthetase
MQSLSGANVQERHLGSIGREDGHASALDADATLDQFRQAGRAAGAVLADVRRDPSLVVHLRRRTRALREVIYSGLSNASLSRLHQDWLVGNARLIVSAEKELRPFPASTRGFPVVQRALPEPALRVCALAELCLDTLQGRFEQESFVAFVDGVQERCELEMGEVWAAKPALQLVILERILQAVVANRAELPALITSLRTICESRWKETFSAINVVDPVLDRDPLGAYAAMDDDSRDHYRNVVAEVAKHSTLSEREVAETAVELARDACARGPTGRAAERRAHVGFYLIDDGLKRLKARVAYRPLLRQRIVDVACARPTLFYLGGVMMTTIALVLVVLAALGPAAALGAIVLLAALATQAAVDVMNNIVAWLVKPRRLPKLDFSDGIPDGCATLVAVPAILLNEQHVRELVMDQEIRYLANRDANLSFALVTNSRDSVQPAEERHEVLSLCEQLIRELNERYGTHNRTPFYLFHRFRAFNPSEGRWMGWERKRGKLLDLNQLLGGVRDRFPVKIGDLRWLAKVRYVITLDSDTELPRDAARRLVGSIAHPLNRAVVDPQTKTVVEGYGILQPRISVSTQSATRSWLASLYSGDVGFDVYTRAISDVYQDLFGEGSFTGKGIYEVDTFRESLERRFPTNTLLSHDLIEGVFARAGLVSDIELIEDYPTHFSAYCRRKHRWMRGDWQLLRWLLNSVPDFRQRLVANPLMPISRWKILDNLRRSLFEPAVLALLLTVWFALPGLAAEWTASVLALLFVPAYTRLLIAMTRAPWWSSALRPWAAATLVSFLRTHLVIGLHVVYLLHDALLAVDAIARSLARMFVTHRRLLEWETAAEAALRTRRGATDVYLKQSPYIACAIGILLWWTRPEALPAAGPMLVLWLSSGAVTRWLNHGRKSRTADLSPRDVLFVREHALRTWRFFRTFSTPELNWLIPDFVRSGSGTANRLTPTNLGFLLNARIAAVHFGYLTLTEFIVETRQTLETMLRMPRCRGHWLNWYDAENLATLEPRFVSTVDSGNLAAALWALRESALAWADHPPSSDVLWDGIKDVARMIGTTDAPGAQALSDRVLKASMQWPQALPELEALVLHFASTAEGDGAWWADELLARLRHARAWGEQSMSSALRARLMEIAATAESLVAEMDFAFLYNPRRKVLSVGFDVTMGRHDRSTYDLLASEARIASFVAIAKGDIPQESWLHLGRAHVIAHGARVLLSWTGTLFEYLMPALWFRERPGTIMHQSMRAAVAAQRRFARRQDMPWGFSESAHIVPGAEDFGYAACGLPALALKPPGTDTVVVSPYSSYLTLLVDRRAALENLRRLERAGCVGAYGFFEAVDYSHGAPQPVACWMAHHQGMILLASAEALFDHPFQRAFHANPHVRATERLLDERVPRTIVADVPEQPRLLMPEESAA